MEETFTYSVGLLGATIKSDHYSPEVAKNVRIHEIERRIIRLEMALRRAGIEVEMIDLDMAVAQ